MKNFEFIKPALGVMICILALILYTKTGFLKDEIKSLNSQILILKNEKSLCNSYLEKQNLEIKALGLDKNKTLKEPKNVKRVEKIFIKDDSCESELKAYKELFNKTDEK